MDVTTQLIGYSLTEKLYEGSRTLVFRGLRDRDQHPVVVKFLKDAFPSFNELMQFSNQYSIAKDLDVPNIVKPLALVPHGNASALVMDDFGGCDLTQFFKQRVETQSSGFSSDDGAGDRTPFPKLGTSIPDLILFFQIAIQVAEALEGIGQARIIHKDIKPANILIHPESRQVKLIDFSIASSLPSETQEIQNLNVLEGTLAYISPEQTGRMNRGIDYRSDFYSFGVTCYKLLTGQLPFTADDPMDIVHGHLARQPVPPYQYCQGNLPVVVSDIVMKLMAKNAEDRYQSAYGLKYDLQYCLEQLKENGQIKPFQLAQQDVCDRFLLPEKIYGRQREVSHLLAAFDRTSGGNTELMLVAGSSGIGKTAIIHEVHKPIARQHGYFIQGKFDQLQQNIPLSAFIQAFRSLIRLLLSESDAQLARWQHQILKAVGQNAQVLIEVFPELERLLGPQPLVSALSAAAAENRFNLLLKQFVQVFTRPRNPLVIFLDDLQWADAASLKLLKLLMQDDGHLLLIGAYRDNEVSPNHPLIATIEDIQAERKQRNNNKPSTLDAEAVLTDFGPDSGPGSATEFVPESLLETGPEMGPEMGPEFVSKSAPELLPHNTHVNILALEPLGLKDIKQFVADTLHSDMDAALPLAEIIYQKARGNPFFSSQILTALHAEGLITLAPSHRGWQYDLAKIHAATLTDNVVEFMGEQLLRLPADTQTALKIAACIGAQFDLETLVTAAQQPLAKVATHLCCALQEGLIVPTDSRYKVFTPQDEATLRAVNPTYRFFHDRVQQAAYALIDPQQQAATHLVIGQRLLQHSSPEQQENHLFEIVNHLNQGRDLITASEKQSGSDSSDGLNDSMDSGDAPPAALTKTALSQLNLKAGYKAKAATAYVAALEYFTYGLELLPPSGWKTHYTLTLDLFNEAAEAAYLTGDLVSMQRYLDVVLVRAHKLLDKTAVYETQIQAAIGQNHFLHGVEITLQVLAQLGVEIPREPSPEHIQQTLHATAEQLGQLSVSSPAASPAASLANLPEMSDPEALTIIRLISKAVSAAYIAKPEVLPLLVCAGIDRCLQFGNSRLSSFLYSWYGVILCGITGEILQGYQMGELALTLLEKLPAKAIQTRVVALVHFLIYPWRTHIKETLSPLKDTFQVGLDNGDNEYAAWAIAIHCHYAYLSGEPLEQLSTKISRYRAHVGQLHQDAAFNYLSIYQQVILNLLGHSDSPTQMEGDAYSEKAIWPIQLAANDMTGLSFLHINKGILAYLFTRPEKARASFDAALNYLPGISSSQWLPVLFFYDSLAGLAIASTRASTEDQLPRVLANQEKLKGWAKLAPMNHLHRWHLVEAERCRLQGDKANAIDHYDQAIALAEANGFVPEEAIANELAAQFYLMWGKARVAQGHMIDAYYGYSRWGARAKITSLEHRYPKLLESILQKEQQSLSSTDTILAYANNTTNTTSGIGIPEVIDLTTLLHTSQIISGEIKLDKLLSALLEAVIQNAGADKCALLMPREDAHNSSKNQDQSWVIEAFSNLGQEPILLQSQLLIPSEVLPVSLINQVKHTQEAAIIFNAAVHADLTIDPYVLRHQPKSILCTPILNQGKLIAILYVENNLTIGAFTKRRVEVLNLICTQAAISLENARLYQQAQQALEELQNSHLQLVQSEKMSALGSLVSGIAHEINNPINFLSGNLKPALRYVEDLFNIIDLVEADEPRENILDEIEEINLEFIREDLPNLLNSMKFGISRIRDISTSLRTFSRADQEHKTAFNIHEGLDSTLLILKHRLASGDRLPPIEVIKHYDASPVIDCFAGQLNQVFMNLMANAIDALEEHNERRPVVDIQANPSHITITTSLADENTVKIVIADNGPGIDEAVQARIFDHLFTTKPVGKGTGLGLAISYAIVVEKHGGDLTVASQVGKGTEFTIMLPIAETTDNVS